MTTILLAGLVLLLAGYASLLVMGSREAGGPREVPFRDRFPKSRAGWVVFVLVIAVGLAIMIWLHPW